MLTKFVAINNVGRFKRSAAQGNVTLKRHTLLYAENGRGKTTLCSILRSLQLNDPSYINGRKTLGSPDLPGIQLLTQGATRHDFANGVWNAPLPEIAIFDSTFVSENVYSGEAVDLGQRRNLYRVIVGREGVRLSKDIEAIDEESRQKATEIRDKAAPLQARLPRTVPLETFLAVAVVPDVDTAIAAKEAEIAAIRESEQIRTRAALAEIRVPALPAGYDATLALSLDGVSADAETKVADQIRRHGMERGGENWLSEGLGYTKDTACPFCEQDLSASDVVAAYRTYFSQAYRDLRSAIGAARTAVLTNLSDRAVLDVERNLDALITGVDFWARFTNLDAVSKPAGVQDTLFELRDAASAILDEKANRPLDAFKPNERLVAARAAAEALTTTIAALNAAIRAANLKIADKKRQTSAANQRQLEQALEQLKLAKLRYEPAVITEVDTYTRAVSEKDALAARKTVSKDALDAHSAAVLTQYEQSINSLLNGFNAGFRIAKTAHAYPGGQPTSSYQIVINDVPVELGDGNTGLGTPSFRNTLSSGDKSTLALAFFLAQLDHDPNKASKIVVFDDPFSSQDSFRRDHTARRVRDCGDSCAQVIVLSHDQQFLSRIWELLQNNLADRIALQLSRVGVTNTAISVWDIESAMQTQYRADCRVLTDYYNDNKGAPRDVVQKIRPVLETYSHWLAGGALVEGDTLGVIVMKIQQLPAHQLLPLMNVFDELNIYTRRYHHGENPNWATEPISEAELTGMVKKAIEAVGCC